MKRVDDPKNDDMLEIPSEEDDLLRIFEEEECSLPRLIDEEEESDLPVLIDDEDAFGSAGCGCGLDDFGTDEITLLDFGCGGHRWNYSPSKGKSTLQNTVALPDKTLSEFLIEELSLNRQLFRDKIPGKDVAVGEEGYGILNVREDHHGCPSEVSLCVGIEDRKYVVSLQRDFYTESMMIFNCKGGEPSNLMIRSDMNRVFEALSEHDLDVYFPNSMLMLKEGDKE